MNTTNTSSLIPVNKTICESLKSPVLKKKLHFKAATDVLLQNSGSLDIGDETVREIVKDVLSKASREKAVYFTKGMIGFSNDNMVGNSPS